MAYNVQIEKFEGPLDLLLELIKKEKLEITEISISKVASQFLSFIENNKNIDAEHLADFLVIAAKLLLIKSKALLPTIDVEEEDEMSAEELEFRLREYEQFKEKAVYIEEQLGNDNIVFQKQFHLSKVPVFYPGDNVNAENLKKALQNLVSHFEKQEQKKEKRIEKTVSISEKISHIQKYIKRQRQLTFSSLFSDAGSKTDVVVTFLALLELIKKQDVSVSQKELFSDITIENSLYEKARA